MITKWEGYHAQWDDQKEVAIELGALAKGCLFYSLIAALALLAIAFLAYYKS
jgi:hypothetical protein